MGDTFDLSEEFVEGEEKIAPTITLLPHAGSLPFETRVLSFQDSPFLIGRSETLPPAQDNATFKYLNILKSDRKGF